MSIDPDEVSDWRDTLEALEASIAPMAREYGYSRDALLIGFMLQRTASWMESLVAGIEDYTARDEEEDGESWKHDAGDDA